MDLSELGITKEELANRLVDKLAKELLSERATGLDEDGDPYDHGLQPTRWAREIRSAAVQHIDAEVARLAAAHVQPVLREHIESLSLQRTNRWGEREGEPQAFIEYLLGRVDSFLTEKVNKDGKTRGEMSYGYDFKEWGTRLELWMREVIRADTRAMVEAAAKQVTQRVNEALQEQVAGQLRTVAAALKAE